MVEHRFRKSKGKQEVLSVARELSDMIANCFNLIDRDVDEVSKIKGIVRSIMTDFLLSSDKNFKGCRKHSEEILHSSRKSCLEKDVNVRWWLA